VRKGDKKFLDFSILGSNYPHFWLIFSQNLTYLNTPQNRISKKISHRIKNYKKLLGRRPVGLIYIYYFDCLIRGGIVLPFLTTSQSLW